MFLAVAVLLIAAGVAPVLYWGGNHDVAWLLYVARRALDGERLYRDIVEINPPLIVVLSMPAVLVSRLTGVTDLTVFDLGLAALAVGVVAFASRQLRRALGTEHVAERRALVLLCLVALFPVAVGDFGQREHLLLALVLPYLFLTAARAEGADTPAGEAMVAGFLAGIALALKPFYVPFWLVSEAYLMLGRRAGPPWKRPESVALAAVLLLYPILVLVWVPDYLRLVRQLDPVYEAFLRRSPWAIMDSALGVLPLLAVAALALAPAAGRFRGLRAVLAAAVATSLLAVLLQRKGWSYHFYPAVGEALLAFAVGLMTYARARPARRSAKAVLLPLALAALALDLGVVVEQRAVEALAWGRFERGEIRDRMVPVARRYATGGSIMAFTVSPVPAFPLVNYAGVGWAMRFPSLWMIPALAAREDWAAEPPAVRAAHRSPDERRLIAAVTDDFVRERPALILEYAPPWGAPNLLGYFASADPRFAAAVRDYRLVDTIADYRFYARPPARGGPPGD